MRYHVIFLLMLFCGFRGESNTAGPVRSFESSFESLSDFSAFYSVPPGEYDSYHELSNDNVHDGKFSHKAWILKARADNNDGTVYLPHRAYPTIQLQKLAGGVFKTPCLVTLWVYLDMTLLDRPAGQTDDWFSFMTFTPDSSVNWARVVTVNIAPDGYVRLMHVPRNGEQQHLFQAGPQTDPQGALRFSYRQWVRLDALIDFDSAYGYAKVWQNGSLVSHANVEGGHGTLAQAHFGLYASAAIPSGTVYNDKLRIIEVANEAEAVALVNGTSSVNKAPEAAHRAPRGTITIMPGPAGGNITVRIAQKSGTAEILDTRGRKIGGPFNFSGGRFDWTTERVPAGVYLLKIRTSAGEINKSLLLIGRIK